MSKILAAVRKSSAGHADVVVRLRTLDRGNLFPPPPPGQMAEFERLANALIHMHGGAEGQTVVFASTVAGEGASFVSYNCARYISLLLDIKVAWIDGNFRSPQKKLAGQRPSLRELILDTGEFPAFDDQPELVVIGNGDTNVKGTALLQSPRYRELLQHLQRYFFFTIIDAPPILEGVEVPHLAEPTQGVVVVVESRKLKREVIQHGIEQLRDQGVHVLGTVLNKRAFDIPNFIYKRL